MTNPDIITLQITIEDLVERHPRAVTFLMEHGIRCLLCGEPAWGTLEDAMREKGVSGTDAGTLLQALRRYLST